MRSAPAWNEASSEPALAAFADWVARYDAAPDEEARRALEPEGLRLAQSRREAFADLIRTDPKTAWESALPESVRRRLPDSVTALLESRVDGRGELALFGALPDPDLTGEAARAFQSNFRTATVGGREYEAHVWGRRLGQMTLRDVALNGIAVDGLLAVNEDPARVLDPAEVAELKQAEPDPVCGVSGEEAASRGEEVALLAGDEPRFFCGVNHAEMFLDRSVAAEGVWPGGSGDFEGPMPSAYTEGVKRLLLIRVDFSDLPGDPFTDGAADTLVARVRDYFLDASYRRTEFLPTGLVAGARSDWTPTFRMPQPAAYYGTNNFYAQLRSDARAAADAAGYNRANYDFDVTAIGPVQGFSWGGLGYVGSPGSWIRNTSSLGTTAHELGHNFGLNHANFWDTAGQSVIGGGTSVEYGDNFDTMGSGGSSRVFNARYKNYLDWLKANEVIFATTNGTYRIFAHDVETSVTGLPRGLRVIKNNGTNYWLEFRQSITANKWLMNGAQLRWAFNGNQKSLLLDTTPGSAAGKDDSPVLVGQTYSDTQLGIHITVLGKGGTLPESLDIAVHRGSFFTNQPPMVTLGASATNASVGGSLTFTASATDPNGDGLAYFWDFGNTEFGGNSPAVTYAWPAQGEYVVRCTVTDLRGGRATDSLIVRVGSPSTFRISGRVLTEALAPVEGVRVYASSSRSTFTDSDGTYNLVGLPAGSFTMNASLPGFGFTHPGFVNPVRVGPNAANVDFVAGPAAGRNLIPMIPSGSEWRFLDDGSDQGEAWREVAFNDSLWGQGPAQLGYGDGDESTVILFGPDPNNKHLTYYFRHAFVVANPFEFASLTLGLLRDDGAVVYLNGTEVFRDNMPEGPVNYRTEAVTSIGGSDELAFLEADILTTHLVPGTNVMAVEIHQEEGDSSDVSFDLSLNALSVTNLPVGVFLTSPQPNANYVGPTNILLSANAWAGSAAVVSKVEFFEGDRKLGEAGSLPYTMVWGGVPFGAYRLTARATDNTGVVLTSAPVNITVSQVLIARGSIWRFYDTGANLGIAWRSPLLNDSTWRSGPAELGYGDGDEATVVSFGSNANAKHIATYFRNSFVVADASAITNLTYRLLRDDGAVVFLNGVEQYRSNMPATGTIGYTTLASGTVNAPEESMFLETTLPAAALMNGTNVVAVEVHQAAANSSDLSFNLELFGTGPGSVPPPALDYVWDGAVLTLSWPSSAAAAGWVLYGVNDLDGDGIWVPVPGGSDVGGRRVVVVTPGVGGRFFRLERR